MKVLVVDNVHLLKDENNTYYSPTIYNYDFLRRYISVFGQIKFVGKVKKVCSSECRSFNEISGEGVEVLELPWYQGFVSLINNIIKITRSIFVGEKNCDCYIFRVIQVESILFYLLRNRRKRYVLEVVNDPDTFTDLPLLYRKVCVFLLKRMIKKADGVSYVTKYTLQKKYPMYDETKFTSHYSSIELAKEMIAKKHKKYKARDSLSIVHVANSINSNAKGHRILIEITKYLINKGYEIKTTFIGDGKKVEEFKLLVNNYGLSNNIFFIGRISRKKDLISELNKHDLMVLPTQTEGLPRTLIEAMASGIPCLSTNIAGIPELISDDYLFDPLDVEGFSAKIISLINNKNELEDMSRKNIEKSKEYLSDKLNERRRLFYSKLYQRVINDENNN